MERVEAAAARLAAGAVRDARPRSTPTTSAWSSTAASPSTREAVRLGIASHNLFDVAYGLLLREDARRRAPGSSSRCSRAWPTTRRARCRRAPAACCSTRRSCSAEDFHSAIAYLVRRLDENTAPENFLRHVFDLEPGSPTWSAERDRFLAAFELQDEPVRRAAPHAGSRGRGRERTVAPPVDASTFVNEPDTDWSLAGQPRLDRGGRRALARAPPGRRSRSQIGGELERGRREARRARSLAPGAGRLPLRAGRPGARRSRAGRRPRRRSRRGRRAPSRSARALLDALRRRARPPARRPHRRDDARRRQDRHRGGRRGLRGHRLRAATTRVRLRDLRDELADCRMEPLGVVVVTPPWNFPLSIPGRRRARRARRRQRRHPQAGARGGAGRLAARPRPLGRRASRSDVLQFLPCPDDEVGRGARHRPAGGRASS